MRMLPSIALAVSVAALTACGGGGDSGSDATKSKRAIQAEAQQRAESMVLELSDFPDGWRASPSTSDKDSADKFRRCIGSDFSALTIIGEAESKDFAHEDTTEASSDSTVFENENQAQDAMGQVSKGMNSPAAEHCFRDLVEKSLSEQESSQGAKIPQYRPSS